MLLPSSSASSWCGWQWPFVSKLFCCAWPLLKPVAISMVPSVIQNKTWGQREPDGVICEDEAAHEGVFCGIPSNKQLSSV